jgi:hypothetical protein
LRSLWKRKWLLMVLALAVFLSVGAAAWAAGTGDDQTPTGDQQIADTAKVFVAAGKPGPLTQDAFKQKRELRVERRKAMLQLVREKMTAEDQALYDQLVKTAEEQREALREAREAVKSTLKELRDLTDKYLDVGAGPAGAVSMKN